MKKITVGSVCSGIEAASIALRPERYQIKWFSEIADFPAKLLALKYPKIPNLGDMCEIPSKIEYADVVAPDLICGGTPCQAFSLAGWKRGLSDERGNLTLKFLDIIAKNDKKRLIAGQKPSLVLWENVEGVLRDKTNAFGCFLSSLLGFESEIELGKYPSAGFIHGPSRNVAWRVIDAKYFGLAQQRKRLFVLASGKEFHPENVLFDFFPKSIPKYESLDSNFYIDEHRIEVFRGYTDCLYTAYGTKWNGNAAAYNGSLFVVQNERLRRLTPLECERIMGFPDGYTDLPNAKRTNRYQALGNSWAVPVIRWIGDRLTNELQNPSRSILYKCNHTQSSKLDMEMNSACYFPSTEVTTSNRTDFLSPNLNGSMVPEVPTTADIKDVIDTNPDERLYISPTGCMGILRRAGERNLKINDRLKHYLENISSQVPISEIERISRIQPRGKHSYVSLSKRKKHKN